MNRMRNLRWQLPFALAFAIAHSTHAAPAAVAGSQPVATTSAETGALAVVERFEKALQGGDRDAVLACLAPEVVIYEHGGAEMSRDEYAHHHLGGDLEYLRATETKRTDRKVFDGGERVVVLTRSETRGEFKGKPVASSGTETLVLERRADAWMIVHVHWSSRQL